MHLTRGERKVIWCFALILLGYIPPVLSLVNRVEPVILGLPFLLFYSLVMVLFTSGLMGYAYKVRAREDGEEE
ncbi:MULTISPECIES: DUF3311 domain-containing protein [Dethiosulfovibrio]|uniref:DUF3311 domain-containing protein n=2 Tax=Dethiosulfovibrio TaxID=47054 RepID=A0ABS9EQJ7_9BACT|nr:MULTISPECIES: DUF3311 domain-containing protein [Dethiosulfovibrio]MCF4115086.1 DUF3311 domain-containing protein [Dethiosulfovibrio russensis]MCF4143472.1 DUF3311 domain-containing protein [Dethiosulfovibrio marinus]MCF4145713.1 DUF3311 domain-containing protein [Dethiosulfovibrio acidaminovorans]